MDIESIIDSHFDVHSRSGDEWTVICKWHDDTSPSMYINVAKGVFYCHVCHISGGRNRLMELLGLTKDGISISPQALRAKLDRIKEKPVGEEMPRLSEAVLEGYRIIPTDYWTETRGIAEDVVDRLELGYDLDRNAGVIPVRTEEGTLRGLIRRMLDPNSKLRYKYTKGMPLRKILYGAHIARSGQQLVIAEGSLDVAALMSSGLNAVGLLGSYLGDRQFRVITDLAPRSVVVFTDNDGPGRDAAFQVGHRLARRTSVRIVQYDLPVKDPGDLVAEDHRRLVDEAVPLHRLA